MKKTLAIWMGYSESFNFNNYKTKKMGGSELSALRFIDYFKDIYDIYVFSSIPDKENMTYIDGVSWLSLKEYNNYNIKWDFLIIFRYINFFIYAKHNAKKTIIWLEDMVLNYYYEGIVLNNVGSELIYNCYDKIDKIVCLSNWHLNNVKKIYPFIEDKKYEIIENPIDLKFFYKNNFDKKSINKIKNRFVYISDLKRGFNLLLDCLLVLQESFPDISLVFFRSNTLDSEMEEKLKMLYNTKAYGYESSDIVHEELSQAEYFFYPAIFQETSCCSAIEAQLYYCVCIYNNFGCLNETIGNRGLQINHDFTNSEYISKTCAEIVELIVDEKQKLKYIEEGRNYALSVTMENLKNKWLSILE